MKTHYTGSEVNAMMRILREGNLDHPDLAIEHNNRAGFLAQKGQSVNADIQKTAAGLHTTAAVLRRQNHPHAEKASQMAHQFTAMINSTYKPGSGLRTDTQARPR